MTLARSNKLAITEERAQCGSAYSSLVHAPLWAQSVYHRWFSHSTGFVHCRYCTIIVTHVAGALALAGLPEVRRYALVDHPIASVPGLPRLYHSLRPSPSNGEGLEPRLK